MFPLEASQYEIMHCIGHGRISVVYVGRCIQNNQLVAIKHFNLDNLPFSLEKLRQEIQLWVMSPRKNMMKYYGSFVEGSVLWFITEFLDAGSVADIMKFGYKEGFTDESLLATLIKGALVFLQEFHRNSCVHRDIRPSNILLSTKGDVKIGALWLAASLIQDGERKACRNTMIETSAYTAPEILLEGHNHKEPADIWSLGITALEMATGKAPYADMTPMEQMTHILNDPPTKLEGNKWSSSFKDFVAQCLNKNPTKRPSAEALLKHKFIKFAKDENYVATTLISQIPSLTERIQVIQNKTSMNSHCLPRKPPLRINSSDKIKFNYGEVQKEKSTEENSENDASSSLESITPEGPPIKLNRFTFSRRKNNNGPDHIVEGRSKGIHEPSRSMSCDFKSNVQINV